MNTFYRCHHISKEVELDHYENGCDSKSRTCTMSQPVNLMASTMAKLLKNVSDYLGHDEPDEHDSYWLGAIESGVVTFNRVENRDGNEPTDHEQEQFKTGAIALWLADYELHVDKVTITPVNPADFEGIPTHK